MPNFAQLVLYRHHAHTGRIRPYKLALDGKKVGSVVNKNSTTIEVPEGDHELVASIDWIRSRPLRFTARAGETVYAECTTHADFVQILKGTFFLPCDHLVLTRTESPYAGPTERRIAEARKSKKAGAVRALAWFFGCLLIGALLGYTLDDPAAIRSVVDDRQAAVGQIAGFVGILGAMLIYLRSSKLR